MNLKELQNETTNALTMEAIKDLSLSDEAMFPKRRKLSKALFMPYKKLYAPTPMKPNNNTAIRIIAKAISYLWPKK